MSKWVEKRFGEIFEIIDGDRGVNYPSQNELMPKGYCLFLNTGNVTKAGFNFSNNQYISCEKDILLRKGKLQFDDIVMTTRGTVGNVALYSKGISFENVRINSGMVLLRAKDGLNIRYLYSLLRSHSLQKSIEMYSSGSAQPQLPIKDMKKIKIKLPDLPTQTRIASILSAYDDAIENNNRRIALLEKAARELYREWFVRFRFPGHAGVKFVNGLPEGWERGKFKDNISYFTGKLDSNEMVSKGQYNFYTCAKTIYKTDSYCYDGECVLLGGNNATGDFSLFYANEKLNAYQRTYIVTPISNRLSCPYIYFVLEDYLHHFKLSSTGAATKFLTKRMLDNFYIILPLQKLSDEYKRIAKTLFDEKINLQSQSQNLARQRDLLLPRLMSGKLEA